MNYTTRFRHVWQLLSDGNGEVKVLALQQWVHIDDIGWWEDVEISVREDDRAPE